MHLRECHSKNDTNATKRNQFAHFKLYANLGTLFSNLQSGLKYDNAKGNKHCVTEHDRIEWDIRSKQTQHTTNVKPEQLV